MSRNETIVIGAGLAGLTSAYYLLRDGHDVRVLERRDDVAMEASFANGGLLTPSMSDPWNAPGELGMYLGWGMRFLANSSLARFRQAMEANLQLAALSLSEIRVLRQQCRLSDAANSKGTMKVFRDRRGLEASLSRSRDLPSDGLKFELLDAGGAIDREPLLAESRDTIVGAIYYPDDESGDAHLFCRELKDWLASHGVRFSFGRDVHRIIVKRERVCALETNAGELATTCVVVTAGAWSQRLVRMLDIRPVKGYSLTLTSPRPELSLSLAIVDDGLHAAATPLGNTVRLAGTAEFSGWDCTVDSARIRMLWDLLKVVSPRLSAEVNRSTAKAWCGLRPVAADGRPYIGPTSAHGLAVNAGHGHLGWTQAAGSALLLSQLIGGTAPTIDPAPYSIWRR